jgi:hypothetical protein
MLPTIQQRLQWTGLVLMLRQCPPTFQRRLLSSRQLSRHRLPLQHLPKTRQRRQWLQPAQSPWQYRQPSPQRRW